MKVIGMISGTSFDAIEAVAMNISLADHLLTAELLAHHSVEYSSDLHRRVEFVLPGHATTIEEVCQLDTLIGQNFAEVAGDLADEIFGGEADVVCSHGQTVFHWVEGGHALGTLQLGQGAWIAERTGATVVEDVRIRDIAAGGHGAPLASLLDVLLLGVHPVVVRGSLNLGGISNMTVVGPEMRSDRLRHRLGERAHGRGGGLAHRGSRDPSTAMACVRRAVRSIATCSSSCSPTRTTTPRHPSRRARSTSTWRISKGPWGLARSHPMTCSRHSRHSPSRRGARRGGV